MKPFYSLLILTFFLTSCEEEKVIYVADHLENCESVTPQTCMLIKENKTDDWNYFYDAIEGFTYEEGYEYILKVKILKIKNPPADASSLAYKLVEVISKEKTQTSISIYGKWIVTNINNFENKTDKSPYFTIQKGQINGNTGCNNFGGSIINDSTGVFQTGMLKMTKMYCEETTDLENAFATALGNTVSYSRSGDLISLFDNQKNKLLSAKLAENEIKDITKKREPLSIRYSATSRGFGHSINFVNGQFIYEEIRPKSFKSIKTITDSDIETIYLLASKIDFTTLEKLIPPSKAHQYDGAAGGTFIIISKGVTYRTQTFDYGNPHAEIKDLIEKLVSLKDSLEPNSK